MSQQRVHWQEDARIMPDREVVLQDDIYLPLMKNSHTFSTHSFTFMVIN